MLTTLPPVRVSLSSDRSPLVVEKFKTRDCCCASITTFDVSAEASIVSVSVISSSPPVSRTVWPLMPVAKVMVLGPAFALARKIASRSENWPGDKSKSTTSDRVSTTNPPDGIATLSSSNAPMSNRP
ncbi:hypothetical protein Pla108_38280 [Botrimarina colliarenosi]|uniref:Uncharacterized protein n=1 Tax=Botrimarina colliarenosi TaxID=2528001 RepID=A0A5C6A3Y0_9BACT|nr:hypothetical protein Pla108_38280 [Botrimarina colliarenosi]